MIDRFEGLLALLESDGAPHAADAAQSAVRMPVDKRDLKGLLTLRWNEEHRLLHAHLPLPLDVPWTRQDEVERAMMRINHRLPLPGFASAPGGVPYFRATLPLGPEGATATQIRRLFSLAVDAASIFLPALAKVAAGEVSADAVVPD